MDIDINDVISMTVNLNNFQSGDSCEIVLANYNNKYDSLIQWDRRYCKSFTIKLGYDGTNVSVFTGRVFISDKKRESGSGGETLHLVLSERNSAFENAPMLSERITNTTLINLVTDCAMKYLGYSADEIITTDVVDQDINVFEVRNESLFKKLKEVSESFGYMLYNDSDGNLIMKKLFENTTIDISYEQENWINWGIKTNLRNELANEIEVIGREKQIDEMIAPEGERTLCVLGYSRFDVNLITNGGIPVVYFDSHSIQFMMKYKDLDFTANDEPGFLWNLGEFRIIQDNTAAFISKDWCIITVPFLDRWGIPTEAEVKYYKSENKKEKGVKCEVWKTVSKTGTVEAKILSWEKNEAKVLVTGLPHNSRGKTDSAAYLLFLYGYAIEDKYLSRSSSVRVNNIYQKVVYEENKQPNITNYYIRRIVKDPVTLERLSLYTGVIKKDTLNLPWLDDSTQLYNAYYNKANASWLKTRPFYLTVPLNPLIERGDLVYVELENDHWCKFWVDSIKHEYSKQSITTLEGYIYQSYLPYDVTTTTTTTTTPAP